MNPFKYWADKKKQREELIEEYNADIEKRLLQQEEERRQLQNKIKNFRQIGEIFYYLSVKMIVTNHERRLPDGSCIPELVADYVGENGEIESIGFRGTRLDAVIAANEND